MARVVIVVEDSTGPQGEPGITVEVSSTDPEMPTKDGTLHCEEATGAQNLAFGAVMEIVGLATANELLIQEEPTITKPEERSS